MQPRNLALVAAVALVSTLPLRAEAIAFGVFVDGTGADSIQTAVGQHATIGFAYAGNKFVGSVYVGTNNNQLYQTDLSGNTVQKFGTPIPGAGGEIYVSSSLGLGGFPLRDIYAAQGTGVYQITNAGVNVGTFASGLGSGVRGIAFDPYGLYGNDMIVTTSGGTVWRVNSAGTKTAIATGLGDVEGLDFAPQAFGPHAAGTLFVASENTGKVWAIAPNGTKTDLGVTISTAEMLSFVPATYSALTCPGGATLEGFYAASYPNNIVYADPCEFKPYAGDAIITQEFSQGVVQRLSWNGASFVTTSLGSFPGQPEDGIFVTEAILNPGGNVPEPGTLLLLAAALAGFGCARRSRG